MPSFRQLWNYFFFYNEIMAKKNVVKVAESASPGWEATRELRQQYIATSFERFPARFSMFREELNAFRERIVHFARNRTLDPSAEVVPMLWVGLELYVVYKVGVVMGRRSLQHMDIKPYKHLPEHH